MHQRHKAGRWLAVLVLAVIGIILAIGCSNSPDGTGKAMSAVKMNDTCNCWDVGALALHDDGTGKVNGGVLQCQKGTSDPSVCSYGSTCARGMYCGGTDAPGLAPTCNDVSSGVKLYCCGNTLFDTNICSLDGGPVVTDGSTDSVVADSTSDVGSDVADSTVADSATDSVTDSVADSVADSVVADSATDSVSDVVDSASDAADSTVADSAADSVSDAADSSVTDSAADGATDSATDTAPAVADCSMVATGRIAMVFASPTPRPTGMVGRIGFGYWIQTPSGIGSVPWTVPTCLAPDAATNVTTCDFGATGTFVAGTKIHVNYGVFDPAVTALDFYTWFNTETAGPTYSRTGNVVFCNGTTQVGSRTGSTFTGAMAPSTDKTRNDMGTL